MKDYIKFVMEIMLFDFIIYYVSTIKPIIVLLLLKTIKFAEL